MLLVQQHLEAHAPQHGWEQKSLRLKRGLILPSLLSYPGESHTAAIYIQIFGKLLFNEIMRTFKIILTPLNTTA